MSQKWQVRMYSCLRRQKSSVDETQPVSRWTNRDLEPTPPEERTWTWYNLPLYWFSTAFGTAGWNVASSLIAVGLTWEQALISCVIGCAISGAVVTSMARPGAVYHIGYPVLARSSMGMYGSFFFVFIRAVIGTIAYGIQTFYGANLLSTCLRCIFGSSWENMPNRLPASAHVTSKTLLCFFLVWMMQFPLCFIHPSRIRTLFTIKGILVPIATFGIFGWCMAHGAGLSTIDSQSKTSSGPLGWAIMSGINTVLGTLSPMLVNQPDLARYCRKPRDAGALQGISVFVAKVLVMFLGLAATSSIQGAWGETYWNFWDLNEAILDRYWTAAGRAGVFLVSFTYLLSVFGMNVGANSIPFGADMNGLLPKILTIRRGQVLCAVLSVCFVPWELIATAQKFITFLGSYNIFMAPICGIIMVDYFIIRRGNIHVPSLYDGRPRSLYWFTSGVHIPGVVAWCVGVSFGLPGLVGSYEPAAVNQSAKDMYKIGWILYASAAAVTYYIMVTFLERPAVLPEIEGDQPGDWVVPVEVSLPSSKKS
ncbi:permease for cytosine/purines, uracil, thiamine, allantoin-domain-containing protein [Pestalotiopsis sp. NC0098]|nr:permease for cytosine/purines, uracil, thiamine, allantoin-domain-containing protein [Pestalotiopsis sp. NC0098]